jgi:prophage maintenance system killer protein
MYSEPLNQTFRESLVPHLHTTLSMQWQKPPALLENLLGKAQPMLYRKMLVPRTVHEQIGKRCGSEAFGLIQRFASVNKGISFALMQEVQRSVLQCSEAEFRKHTAYTSVRPERYAYFTGIEDLFTRKVKQDDEDDLHPLLKAARLYLDLIFFHPFNDGNARAAMLWLAFSCLRAGYPAPDLRKIIVFPFKPGDEENYWSFTGLLANKVILALYEST